MLGLVLASASRYKRRLLEGVAGLDAVCVAPDYVECPDGFADVGAMVRAFAEGKALSVSGRFPDCAVIGADQAIECGGRIYGKPGTAEAAFEQLCSLRGRRAELVNGVAVMVGGRLFESFVDFTHLNFRRDLTDSEIEAYVGLDEPLDCAGSFKIESRGAVLFESVEGGDPTAIQGLPVMRLLSVLRRLGINPLVRG